MAGPRKIDLRGAANFPAVAATLSRLLFAVSDHRAADPILFLPLAGGGDGDSVPVKVAAVGVEEGKLTLQSRSADGGRADDAARPNQVARNDRGETARPPNRGGGRVGTVGAAGAAILFPCRGDAWSSPAAREPAADAQRPISVGATLVSPFLFPSRRGRDKSRPYKMQ